MADTRVQVKVEDWVRREWLAKQYGQPFSRERMPLRSGGVFDFDGVSQDQQIVACISTGAGITMGGKHPSAKVQKLRSDMYFLLLAAAPRRLLCVTARNMYDLLQKERAGGRLAPEIEVVHAELPVTLEAELEVARQAASRESSRGSRRIADSGPSLGSPHM